MLWSDDVMNKNDHAAKRLWLTGMIASGLAANPNYKLSSNILIASVETADLILNVLLKEDTK